MRAPLSHRIAAAAMLVMLLFGLLATIVAFDPLASAIRENRKRSPPPSAGLRDWQAYIDEANAYLGDNHGLRSILIREHALFREHVLNANSSDNIFLDAIGLDVD